MRTSRVLKVLIIMTGLLIMAVMPASAKTPSQYKIVLILPGPINDQSWNATNYAGLVACNKT